MSKKTKVPSNWPTQKETLHERLGLGGVYYNSGLKRMLIYYNGTMGCGLNTVRSMVNYLYSPHTTFDRLLAASRVVREVGSPDCQYELELDFTKRRK